MTSCCKGVTIILIIFMLKYYGITIWALCIAYVCVGVVNYLHESDRCNAI